MAHSRPADDCGANPLAWVGECRADRQVVLDDRFIPSVLKAGTGGRLATFLMELQGLLHQRAEALAARAVGSGRGGASEIADFLMLQVINRYEPVVAHLASSPALHPEDLYRLTLEITGELSTLKIG